MTRLTKAEKERLDGLMMAYLDRKSVTSWHSIACHFELHDDWMLQDSLGRLEAAGRVSFDERRDGYQTHRPMLRPNAARTK